MDYKEKYEQALERAREDISSGILARRETARYIFPELRESSEEMVRRTIISTLYRDDYLSTEEVHECVAWLEKQGEQKTTNVVPIPDGCQAYIKNRKVYIENYTKPILADKVKPKFKIGDFIVNDYCMGRVVELTNDAYLLDTEQGIPFSCEHNVRLWTIQDANDGDIIYIKRHKTNDEWLLIFKKIKIQNRFIDVYDYYAFCITSNNAYHESIGIGCWGLLADNNDIVCPATKEQCNLLFAKMKEEGLGWDAENKVLRKISQEYPLTSDECVKPTWSEEDEEMLRSIMATCELAEQERDSSPARHLLEMQLNWLKSLKEKLKGE